jgi:hypothetical protein
VTAAALGEDVALLMGGPGGGDGGRAAAASLLLLLLLLLWKKLSKKMGACGRWEAGLHAEKPLLLGT